MTPAAAPVPGVTDPQGGGIGRRRSERRLAHPAAAPPDAAVALVDVSRIYGRGDSRVDALRGTSLSCRPGTWTAIMGPSGSGKSTLLHCAAGLERVSSGQVWLTGRDFAGASDHDLTLLRRREVGFVFQSFNLMGALTAEQNVALPLRLAGQRIERGRPGSAGARRA